MPGRLVSERGGSGHSHERAAASERRGSGPQDTAKPRSRRHRPCSRTERAPWKLAACPDHADVRTVELLRRVEAVRMLSPPRQGHRSLDPPAAGRAEACPPVCGNRSPPPPRLRWVGGARSDDVARRGPGGALAAPKLRGHEGGGGEGGAGIIEGAANGALRASLPKIDCRRSKRGGIIRRRGAEGAGLIAQPVTGAVAWRARASMRSIFTSGTRNQASAVKVAEIRTRLV
jgi:hypothetical protein